MLSLSSLVVAVSLAAPSGSAGVVVSGPDPAASGALQRRIEARLAGLAAGAETLAPRLASSGTPRAPVVDVALQQEGDRLLKASESSYYDGNVDDALARLAELEKLATDSPAMPVRTRARLLVWRAAIFLEKTGTQSAAETPMREALAIAPDLVIDERTFPPLVVALASRVKKTLKPVQVTLSGLPAGAKLRVDDVDVPAPPAGAAWRTRVPAGRHRFQAWAPGYELVTTPFEATTDAAISLSLPLALEPAEARAFAAVSATRGSAEALAPLAARLDVELLAGVVRTNSGLSGFLWHRKKVELAPASPATPAGETAIADWLAARIREKAAQAVQSRSAPPPRNEWGFSAAALGAARTRDTRGGGNAYSATFGGAGAALGGSGRVGSWIGLGEVSYLSYGFSPVTADLPDGRRATGNGGATIGAELAGGWQLVRPESSPSFFAAAGLGFERHDAADLETSDGSLGFFPSHQRTSLELHAGGRYPLRIADLHARVTLRPLSQWSEDPDGASGSDASGGLGLGLRLGASRERGAWQLAARYQLEHNTATFSGTAQTPLARPVRDAVVTETVHGFAVQAGRRF